MAAISTAGTAPAPHTGAETGRRHAALAQAEAMVSRYEFAVALHAPGQGLSQRQRVEVSNLAHWRRKRDSLVTRSAG